MGCHYLLQGIFPIQGSNPHLLHWQMGSISLSHHGSPYLCMKKWEGVSRSVMSNSLKPHGLQPTRLFCPWNSPSKNTGERILSGPQFPHWYSPLRGFSGGSVVKNPPANAGAVGSISGSGRSPGEGNGNPLQYSCLGNPMDRGAWQATVHGITQSWTQLSTHTHTHTEL